MGYKKAIILTTSIAALATAGFFGWQFSAFAGGRDVLAHLSGQPLTTTEIEAYLKKTMGELPEGKKKISDFSAEEQQQIVRMVAIQKLLDQEVETKKIHENQEFKEALARNTNGMAKNFLLQEHVKQSVKDSDIKKAYDEMVANFGKPIELHLRQILVDNEETIKKVVEALERGEKFESLAEQYSKDPSKNNGGDVGFVQQNALLPEIRSVTDSLKLGEVSKPVHGAHGWHILRLEERREAKPPVYEEIKPRIQQELQQKAADAYVTALLEAARFEPKPVAKPADKADKKEK
jgi:peptidyl-prolyl cis-trans isomerase C